MAQRNRLLKDVLKGVSRSFYLTLRVLPKGLREPVGLAYLLARATDTITDRRGGLPGQRLESLVAFRNQVVGPVDSAVLQGLVVQSIHDASSPKEQAMFESLVDCFALLESLDAADQEQVRWVVTTLTQGMEMDLTAFSGADSEGLVALPSAADLDRYIYLVAGCVGEFWTKTSIAHQPELKDWDVGAMSETGVRFGKALQLTNVLRDVPRDLRMGRCYLPADELAAAGLEPKDLLNPGNVGRAKPVFDAWVRTALGYFDVAEEYLLAIPRRSVRLRLACLWPLLLGLVTLARLARSGAWLEPESTVKVSRRWVYWMIFISPFKICSNSLIRHWIGIHRRQVEDAI
ncbi:MAG: squalene/phytoene synthase family protein [SAR202 cluster bacterium]|nr:squalene/phytoene synthase family protein [SAR202 cluster bacterium]